MKKRDLFFLAGALTFLSACAYHSPYYPSFLFDPRDARNQAMDGEMGQHIQGIQMACPRGCGIPAAPVVLTSYANSTNGTKLEVSVTEHEMVIVDGTKTTKFVLPFNGMAASGSGPSFPAESSPAIVHLVADVERLLGDYAEKVKTAGN